MENKNVILLKRRCRTPYVDQCATYEDYTRIDVTSGSRDPQVVADLSPLYIGPVVASDGEVALTFENLWQYSKVYARVKDAAGKAVPGVDAAGDPTDAYWDWRRRFFAVKRKGSRHPAFPSGIRHRDCLYSVYLENGVWQHLGYVEARKKIYIPEYAKLVVGTDTFKRFRDMVERGEKLALVDYDGWNYYGKYLTDPVTIKDMVNDPRHRIGHSYVIKMLLQGDIEVKGGQVVDHIGVLK